MKPQASYSRFFPLRAPFSLVVKVISCGLILLPIEEAYAGTALWDLNPGSGDWNTAANWTPATVPNGSTDTATFALSSTTNVSISANTEVNGIKFTSAASAYTITASPNLAITLSGTGITNNSGTTQTFVIQDVNGAANGGQIFFKNSATAGNSTLFTNSGGAGLGQTGGLIQFLNNASAAHGAFMNNGGVVSDSARGGHIIFRDRSTAANGTFTNNGAAISLAGGPVIMFFNMSTAGSGTFINNGAAANSFGAANEIGIIDFLDTSTAANGSFTNNGGAASGAAGANINFTGNSTAGNGMFTNNGGTVSGALAGATRFFDSATAANGTFINNGATVSGAGGGSTQVGNAANGAFINNGATVSGAGGGFTTVFLTAANGMFTNNGATVNGANGGLTEFLQSSTSDTATLIANSGSNGGAGGTILFAGESNVGQSRIEIFGNGSLDISLHNAPGMTINSIEGDGNVFLGANKLTVGGDNTDTTFSCAIQDGGRGGGVGGSLTKIGTGTLDLIAANAYTGDTNVNGGVLKVDGSITSNTFVKHGGTLAGTGTISGDVVNKGTVNPGDALGTLTVNGNYAQASALLIDIAGASTGQFSLLNVLGTTDLSGVLDPVLLNGFVPTIGESFAFLDYAGLTGAFSRIQNQVFDNGMEQWNVVYQPNEAILTVGPNTIADHGSTFVLLILSLVGLVRYRRQLLRGQL